MGKVLGIKVYGSIPHLPGSKLGPGDHHIGDGQANIATVKTRDKHDQVFVHIKLDGSCCAVAKTDDHRIVALGRSGYLAESSKYLQHHLFSDWVYSQVDRFQEMLKPGERVVGEWLVQSHSIRYLLQHEPFVIFDLFSDGKRLRQTDLMNRVFEFNFKVPRLLHCGFCPPNPLRTAFSVDETVKRMNDGLDYHGHIDPPEGAVWRVERDGKVDFLAKWVRPDFMPGRFLPELSGNPEVWNDNLEDYLPSKAIDRLRNFKTIAN